MYSVRHVYEESCERCGCRKNGQLMRTLSTQPGSLEMLEELDLRRNLLGKKGVRPVMDVVNACPNLTRLYLADNFLTNDSLAEIATCLYGNQSLTYLDLSRNPISHPAGKVLGEFADHNCVMKKIVVDGTFINPAVVKSIDAKLKKNRTPEPSLSGRSEHDDGAVSILLPELGDAARPDSPGSLEVLSDLAEEPQPALASDAEDAPGIKKTPQPPAAPPQGVPRGASLRRRQHSASVDTADAAPLPAGAAISYLAELSRPMSSLRTVRSLFPHTEFAFDVFAALV
eukprot:TRINITY_DN28493_c0_g1_i1.p1 TRINITY_DN28493_c0_g1~~TRINITY_DN28493_c0_g1_i1.p1  ORF type:complete len:285 (+),score=108.11 TRINITY_DN28493_c0_g1_i1:143-997(+)